MRLTPRTLRGYFNPRSPHGERHTSKGTMPLQSLFQPTLPARGATKSVISGTDEVSISTHAPRTGSDTGKSYYWMCYEGFQPTLPARGATCVLLFAEEIRTHFNPRSPHGERLAIL